MLGTLMSIVRWFALFSVWFACGGPERSAAVAPATDDLTPSATTSRPTNETP